MSFHLTFAPATGALDTPRFEALFAGLANFEVADGQAAYQNEDTGVYFLFDHEDAGILFSINTGRSEIFAREAAEVLAAAFAGGDFVVAETEKPFDAEGFLAAWRQANLAAIRAMLAEGKAPLTLPLRTNLAVWGWNRGRVRQQIELEHEATAPPLMFFAGPDGNPRATYVWLVTMPMVKPPPAEAVLLADEPAPRLRDKLFGAPQQPDTIGVIEIKWMRDLRFPGWRPERAPELMLYHARRADRTPVILASLAAAEGYARPAGPPIPIDQVLDRETVEAARAASD
ncbi:MAG: hypothetical protein V4574_07735 [Pseudomonadota bacterium]